MNIAGGKTTKCAIVVFPLEMQILDNQEELNTSTIDPSRNEPVLSK
jgi:hypothetical protein